MSRINNLFKIKSLATCDLEYVELGDPNNRTIILIHGLFGSALSWLYCLVPLSKFFHVIAINLPGHGRSRIFAQNNNLVDLEWSVLSFIEELDIKEIGIVGHSFGAQIAARLFKSQMGVVKSACYICPYIHGKSAININLINFINEPNAVNAKNLANLLLEPDSQMYSSLLDDINSYLDKPKSIEIIKNWIFSLTDSGFIIEDSFFDSKNTILSKNDQIIQMNSPAFAHRFKTVEAGHLPHIEKPTEIINFIVETVG